MQKSLVSAIIGGVAVAMLGLWAGVLNVQFPWQVVPDFTEIEVDVALPEEATIVAVEPIALDCRARVHAIVPIEGRREHTLFGKVYRTDTLTMEAIGDVDTCVEGTSAEVIYNRDGTTEVIIPGESILFVRPRVDAVQTADSVEVDKGTLGKLTDVFPWVDDDLGLTPLGYAYAQNVIGSSDCMQAAYQVTEQMLIDAYTEQFVANGANREDLTVRIDGEPNFTDPPPVELDGVDMLAGDDVTCVLGEDLAAEAGPDGR